MRNISVYIFVFFVLASTCWAEYKAVFVGYPNIRHICDEKIKVVTDQIYGDKKDEYKCIITKDDEGAYYWASRENKLLVHRISGAYDIFVEISGAGIIKIADDYFLSVSDENRPKLGESYQYFESMSLGLATYAYWGKANSFNP